MRGANRVFAPFLELLFPKYCLGCDAEGAWVCAECVRGLVFASDPNCPLCRSTMTACGFLCTDCRSEHAFMQALFCYEYRTPLVAAMVAKLKYEYAIELSEHMGRMMANFWALRRGRDEHPFVMPVPLHKKRLAERGFNQAELLVQHFCAASGLVCLPLALVRRRNTESQVGLSLEDRVRNVAGAFCVREGEEVRGRTVILIDDVCTTGSTLSAAASALGAAGAKKVIALTFARG